MLVREQRSHNVPIIADRRESALLRPRGESDVIKWICQPTMIEEGAAPQLRSMRLPGAAVDVQKT